MRPDGVSGACQLRRSRSGARYNSGPSSKRQEGTPIPTGQITELLSVWRAAERRWERVAPADDVRAAALAVVDAWAAYQDAALPADSGEFTLVADDDGTYVKATEGVRRVLGYRPGELIGRRIQDVAAPDLQDLTSQDWQAFLAAGRQEGVYRLVARDGTVVPLRFQARAHHPVPGFHSSRLWRDGEA
jgi:PAS domain S-box-containing protein